MISLDYEMTYRETIDGPLAPTAGAPLGDRLGWQITAATLTGPRIAARLAMPGSDWIRRGPDGIHRQDMRVSLVTDDRTVILMHCDTGLIRATDAFLTVLRDGGETDWQDQYIRVIPEFIVGAGRYAWLTGNLFIAEGRLAGRREIEYAIHRVL